MEENNTVKELSQALNKLLIAYEKLQDENHRVKGENLSLKEDLQEYKTKSADLEEKLESLTDTTTHQTTEMDDMLSKISSILGEEKPVASEAPKEEEVVEDETTEIEPVEDNGQNSYSNTSGGLDLGRMQNLLNGLNN
ncbi:MAG: hypothetical protein U9O56_10130 [Campylobacterota bacterium]|nr:hypothetical protein [Campylobacterota bacterium]